MRGEGLVPEGGWAVREITAEATRPVRHAVLWPHKPDAAACVIAGEEEAGVGHLGAFDGAGRLVGVCSLFPQRSERFPEALPPADPVYRLRVMGTRSEVRGLGAGAALVEEACRWAAGHGAHWLWCDAREVALGFYARMGFGFLSETYDVPEIGPHRMMARRLVEDGVT